MCISWPILFPVHITGGNGVKQLDILTLGNVSSKQRLYAHVVVAYMFFGTPPFQKCVRSFMLMGI